MMIRLWKRQLRPAAVDDASKPEAKARAISWLEGLFRIRDFASFFHGLPDVFITPRKE